MNRDFKLKFDQMRQSNPSPIEGEDKQQQNLENEFYPAHGNNRNLCLTWPDRRSMFLNYAYLVSGEYLADENKIVLTFTSHIVEIKGLRLEVLFQSFLSNTVKRIVILDMRYNKIDVEIQGIVNRVVISKNDRIAH